MPRATPKLAAYALLGVLGALAGLALARPEPVLLGAPFLLALVLGVAGQRPPPVAVTVGLARDRIIEGDAVTVSVELVAADAAPWVDVELRLPASLALAGPTTGDVVALSAGVPARRDYAIRARHWGGYLVGEVVVRSRDQLGFFVREQHLPAQQPLRVYPQPEALRAMPPPAETQVFAGNERARVTGDGIEFADIRPFVPGDRMRRINWRLTTRLGTPYVNERHRERNADVVLLLDTFAEARHGDRGTRFQAVRAAAMLADRYLQHRDRVGLVSFGGIMRWLRPAMGQVQRYRIIEALIETEIFFSYAWKAIAVVPPAVLPPQALVIAISPLLDERTITALLNLRGRHFDLAIIEVAPAPFIAPPADATAELARRIWRLEREVLRTRFQRLGVPIATWVEGEPLESPVQEVMAFRRSARLARA